MLKQPDQTSLPTLQLRWRDSEKGLLTAVIFPEPGAVRITEAEFYTKQGRLVRIDSKGDIYLGRYGPIKRLVDISAGGGGIVLDEHGLRIG